MRYSVVLIPDPDTGAWEAHIPAFPLTTFGATTDEALAMAADAATARLAIAAQRGDELDVEAPGAMYATIEVEFPAVTDVVPPLPDDDPRINREAPRPASRTRPARVGR
jgi:predicted RNase H-like HicB family nuclease